MSKRESSQGKLIADGINKVFEHRKNFLVIGLTGRTGSGCSTAAGILAEKEFSGLKFPSIHNPPENQEHRKLRIIRLWAEVHWHPFNLISVTSLIFSLAIKDGVDSLIKSLGNR